MASKFAHLTFEQRKYIEIWLKEGNTQDEIARLLGKAPSSISEEVSKNGGREKYSAQAAQERYESVGRVVKGVKSAQFVEFIEKYKQLEEKMACLEMQLQIVIEELKKINRGL